MIWLLSYCVLCVVLFFLGSEALGLGWFWNTIFYLFLSGAIICGAYCVIVVRLCPRRVKAALASGSRTKARLKIEEAFGKTPIRHDEPSEDANMRIYLPTATLAWPAISVVAFQLLEPAAGSVFWQVVLALAVGIPGSAVLAALVIALAGPKATLRRMENILKDHDPEQWNRWKQVWGNRLSVPNALGAANREKDRTAERPDRDEDAQLLRCSVCGHKQRDGEWEEAMDVRAKAMGSRGFVNLSAPQQCLKCGSTDLIEGSRTRTAPEHVVTTGYLASHGRRETKT